MDVVSLLSDDHAVLSSDVLHLVALVRAVADGRFLRAHLQRELQRQASVLGGQLMEHFDFEESTAFPRLADAIPAVEGQLHLLIQDHDRILETFEAFRTELELGASSPGTETLLPRVLAFEQAFENHATEETALFEDLCRMIESTKDS